VLAVWLTATVFGRDLVSLSSVQHPRDAFVASGNPPRSGENREGDHTAA
ncbi:NAD(P)/FAD-dependent oxidoreductase, partial [Streptomyces chiangmaiensis]|nr:NAD(P)/FAD-dependent oxidoreductase [Streptomyces chiangmaiensis]